jgi:hypothetical protein
MAFDEQEFQKTLTYLSDAAPETVLADLEAIRQFDQGQEEHLAREPGGCGWYLLVWLVCFFVGSACTASSSLEALAVILLLVSGAAFALMVWNIIRSVKFSRIPVFDLDNRRYELATGLVRLAGADMGADQPLAMQVDFREHTHEDHLQRRGKVGHWNAEFYVDQWLQLEGRLVDGTKFTIRLIEKQQERSRTKWSRSGKLKTKEKTKISSEAIVSLKFKGKRYPRAAEQSATIEQYLKLPQWTTLKSVDVSGPQLTLRSTTTSVWSAGPALSKEGETKCDGVQWVAMMLLSLYAMLHASK